MACGKRVGDAHVLTGEGPTIVGGCAEVRLGVGGALRTRTKIPGTRFTAFRLQLLSHRAPDKVGLPMFRGSDNNKIYEQRIN